MIAHIKENRIEFHLRDFACEKFRRTQHSTVKLRANNRSSLRFGLAASVSAEASQKRLKKRRNGEMVTIDHGTQSIRVPQLFNTLSLAVRSISNQLLIFIQHSVT